MKKNSIKLYTYDHFTAEAVLHILLNLRNYRGELPNANQLVIVDNRISNHALRAIPEVCAGNRRPVIWLVYEPFYGSWAREDDFFINPQSPLSEIELQLRVILKHGLQLDESKPSGKKIPIHGRLSELQAKIFAYCFSSREKMLKRAEIDHECRAKTLYSHLQIVVRKMGYYNFDSLVYWTFKKESFLFNERNALVEFEYPWRCQEPRFTSKSIPVHHNSRATHINHAKVRRRLSKGKVKYLRGIVCQM